MHVNFYLHPLEHPAAAPENAAAAPENLAAPPLNLCKNEGGQAA